MKSASDPNPPASDRTPLGKKVVSGSASASPASGAKWAATGSAKVSARK